MRAQSATWLERRTFPAWARAAVTFGTRTGSPPMVAQVFSSAAAAERFAMALMRTLPPDFSPESNWPAVWALVHYRDGASPYFPCHYSIDNGGKVAKDHRVSRRAHLRARIDPRRPALAQ